MMNVTPRTVGISILSMIGVGLIIGAFASNVIAGVFLVGTILVSVLITIAFGMVMEGDWPWNW